MNEAAPVIGPKTDINRDVAEEDWPRGLWLC